MTVIVWDGRMMAADRMATNGGVKYSVAKLFRIDADRIAGVCGHLGHGLEVAAWLRANGPAADYPKNQEADGSDWCTVLVAHRDGTLCRYESRAVPIPVLDPVHALGSGSDYALAAMSCGKSAAEAVEIASRWSLDCGLGVDVLTFEGEA